MKITEKIYESLSAWGSHPACIELHPDNSAVHVSARQFIERIDDASRMLKNMGL